VTPQGRALSYRGIARTFAEVLSLVAAGENVFPTAESFPAYYGHPEVRFVLMRGWPPATRILLTRRRAEGNAAAFTGLAAEPGRSGNGHRRAAASDGALDASRA